MKKTYFISFLTLIILSGLIYYGSYRYAASQISDDERNRNMLGEVNEEKTLTVDTTEPERVTDRTMYVLEKYNAVDYTLEEIVLPPPAVFVGLTRGELISHLQEYERKPSIEDIEEGFESFELISFSGDKIVLRKSYHPSQIEYKYYLIPENDLITVYYMDKKTVYSYTDIHIDSLPETMREEIRDGKFITDIHQLYNFLENYSS